MKYLRQLGLSICVGLSPFFGSFSHAQPVLEETNPTQIVITETATDQFLIDGGSLSSDGVNLFLGFESFDLNAQQSASFLNTPNATNLFSTISGGNSSFINGLVEITNGTPNLYFINPAGIIFGENVQLNVPNAFIGTTATALGFDNGWLNVVGSNDFSTLVGEPKTFAFNTSGVAGDIFIQGDLQVPAGTLGLIGGRVQTAQSPEGDRQLSAATDLLITTATDQNLIRLQQPGNLLSLELDINGVDLGNNLDFSVNQLPQLLTGSGIILDSD